MLAQTYIGNLKSLFLLRPPVVCVLSVFKKDRLQHPTQDAAVSGEDLSLLRTDAWLN